MGGIHVAGIPSGTKRTIAPPCGFVSTCRSNPVWSRDERKLYALREGAIWEFSVDGSSSRSLHAAADLEGFALSPDGQSIAFSEAGNLRVLSLAGGPPRTVFTRVPPSTFVDEEAAGEAIVWSPDGKSIAFILNGTLQPWLYGVNADGTGLKAIRRSRYRSDAGIAWGQ